jgi:adenosylhomocysteinase
MPLTNASRIGDVFVTVTGDKNVIDEKHLKAMKDGAILCNSGHFNAEINIAALKKMSKGQPREIRPFVEQYTTKDGRKINLLGDGRLINLAAAEGHPSSVMDMSFANQALGAEYMVRNFKKLTPNVYTIPEDVDREIARLKLASMGIKIDKLTAEQKKYLSSWEEGT